MSGILVSTQTAGGVRATLPVHDRGWRWWAAAGASLMLGWAPVGQPPTAHALPVLPAAGVADPGWTAFVDTNGDTAGNATDPKALTLTSPTGAGTLRRFEDGSEITGVQVAASTTGTVTKSGSGANTAVGTEAHSEFESRVDLTGLLAMEPGSSTSLLFSGLDPDGSYTLVATANRDRPGWADQYTTTFGLEGAVTFSPGSSVGTQASADGAEATFSTGFNTVNGYVARWTGIDPGADGQITLTSGFGESLDATSFGASAVLLQLESDTVAPVITLRGEPVVDVPFGAPFTDQGATASDDKDGVVAVVVGGDTVDTLVPGAYVIVYNASDAAGNAAVPVTRTVNVQPAAVLTQTPVPTITGTTKVGRTLTANPGTWAPAPVDLAFQWLRDGAVIEGATGPAHLLAPEDVASRIAVTVTGSKVGYGSVAKTSVATGEVVEASLSLTAKPTLVGTRRVGETLSANAGAWGPGAVEFTYRWYRNTGRIKGAAAQSYLLVAADKGKRIRVKVTGSRDGYLPVTRTSSRTGKIVVGVLTPKPTPTIGGTAAVGQVLAVDTGTWGPAPVKLAIRWLRSGDAIKGATAATYRLTAADRGKRIAVRVTGSKSGFKAISRTSTATAKVVAGTLDPTPVPTIQADGTPVGIPVVGQKLKAIAGTWGPGSVTLAYRWYRTDCASPALDGPYATGSSYALPASAVGRCIVLTVTGTKPGYAKVVEPSVPTAQVVPQP